MIHPDLVSTTFVSGGYVVYFWHMDSIGKDAGRPRVLVRKNNRTPKLRKLGKEKRALGETPP